jgi:hypothetical protein
MEVLVLCTENQSFLIKVSDELRLLIDKKVIFSEKLTTSIRITQPIWFSFGLKLFET